MNNVEFLKSIVKGVNPYTNEFFYSDDILRSPDVVSRLKVLINEIKGYDKWHTDLIQVFIPETTITYFAKTIAEVTSLKADDIKDEIRKYLTKNGYLKKSKNNRYYATEAGEEIGITNKPVPGAYDERITSIYYSVDAQFFVISKLPEILKKY